MRWFRSLAVVAMMLSGVSAPLAQATDEAAFLADYDTELFCYAFFDLAGRRGLIAADEKADADAAFGRIVDVLANDASRRLPGQQVDAILQTYADEVGMQLDEFTASRDPAAFRINAETCFTYGAHPPGPALANYAVTGNFTMRFWCEEAFALMQEHGLFGTFGGGYSDADRRYILEYMARKQREEKAALQMPEEDFEAYRQLERDRVADAFRLYLQTRNPDDLEVIPSTCFSIDFGDTVYFDEQGNMAFAERPASGDIASSTEIATRHERLLSCLALAIHAVENDDLAVNRPTAAAAQERLLAALNYEIGRSLLTRDAALERLTAASGELAGEIERAKAEGRMPVLSPPPEECLSPAVVAGATPIPDAAAETVEARTTASLPPELAEPMTCYFTLTALGIDIGFPDARTEERAGYAMAALQERYSAEAAKAGISGEALSDVERQMRTTIGEQVAAAHATGTNQAVYETCLAHGAAATAQVEDHRRFVEMADGQLWCLTMMTFLERSQVIGGGEQRLANARRALEVLEARLRFDQGVSSVPPEVYGAVLQAYWQRAIVQGMAFMNTQDWSKLRLNFLSCFDWAERPTTPDIFSELNGVAPPRKTAGGYPVPEEFIVSLWCSLAGHEFVDRGLMDESGWTDDELVTIMNGGLERAYAMTEELGIPHPHYVEIVKGTSERVKREFSSFVAGGDEDLLEYPLSRCRSLL